ncbi:MAG: glycosyltransferase [Bryobacterales bacterium]|nr:glycosyltransferase [Bryobacterales bacterium]
MIWLLYAICAAAAGYQLVALAAVLRQLLRRDPKPARFPTVSILKPVHGADAFFEAAIRSHTAIDYPSHEVLFGVNHAADEAAESVSALPGARLYVSPHRQPNAKVANLMELERRAMGEIWVVNDGDILVTPEYLRRIVAPLEDPRVGLVTCLYRPVPLGLPAVWESLGIAIDFAPSTLVAPLVGIDEFGLGSTLCFRAAEWKAQGGFASIGEYLADDYQLAKRLTKGQAKRAVMSRLIVDTGLRYADWGAMWRHQIRWARTIRVSRGEYLGLPVTHAGLWMLAAALCGQWPLAAILLLIRTLTAFTAARFLLRTSLAWAIPFFPLWDLFASAVWACAWTGNTIEWRGQTLPLSATGKLGLGNWNK